ncbi:MAG: exosortase system-associated protein, TIGR04073 family [Verrucomicrobia bacterium]|nr:exosortase system-associated protein, TIGR04073 family [Verrucomicrobiota bacterium]
MPRLYGRQDARRYDCADNFGTPILPTAAADAHLSKSRFTTQQLRITFRKIIRTMRITLSSVAAVAAMVILTSGCAGPERKLGRGMRNVSEFARMGEVRRSMEQTWLWDQPDGPFTRGLIRGFNRSLARTAVGAYEIVTFPFPSYDPVFYPEANVHPDSYRPNRIADPVFGPDSALGFSGGDIAPMIPGSRFRIFDY